MSTPTPRTDAKTLTVAQRTSPHYLPEMVWADFARELERELADQAARFHDEIVSRQGTVRANQELDLKKLNQLRTELAEWQASAHLKGEAIDSLLVECDRLRADCENETKWAAHYLAQSIADKARADKAEAALTDPQQLENSITFHCGQAHQEIMRLDKDGMTYKGQRIEDGGEAHRAFLEVMSAMKEAAK